MFCKNCGNKIEEGTLFCSKCGVKVESINNIVSETLGNNFNNNVNNPSNANLNNNTSSNLVKNQSNISNQESQNINSNLINNQNTVNNIGNNQNSNMTNVSTKKNNTLFIIIVIIASIIILTLISFIVVKMLSSHTNDYQTSTSTNNNNNVTEINNDNKNNYEITLGNYKFKLPTDLLYKNGDDYILATNNDKTFIFTISVYNFAYSDLVNGYQAVVNEIQNSGITVTDVNEVSNGSTNIFLFDLNDGENIYQAYYTELDTNTTIGGTLQVYNSSLFNTAFNYIEKIKDSKEKVGSFGKDTKEEINIKNYKIIREDSFVLKKD